ncbi:MAG: hypothetical protein ACYCVB_10775 [Bacilli bacterium]
MRAVKVIIGLIYDDKWLVGGIAGAIIIAKLLAVLGLPGAVAGVMFMVLLFGAVLISVVREVRTKGTG